MSFAQKWCSSDEVVHSPNNVIKCFQTIPFDSLITVIEIKHGRNFSQLFNACSSHQDFSVDVVSKILNLFILCASEKMYYLSFFLCSIGKEWSCNSLNRPEAILGLPGYSLLFTKVNIVLYELVQIVAVQQLDTVAINWPIKVCFLL